MRASARALLAMLERGIRPRDIMTRKAFENAIRTVMALGGSTNAALHLLALAREAEVRLEAEEFNYFHDTTPTLTDMKPAGRYAMEDLHAVGGVPLVMRMLLDRGLLHGDCLTCTGKTVAENLAGLGLAGKRIVTLAFPVTRGGKTVGAVCGDMGFSRVATFVESSAVGSTGYAFILDSRGVVVAHPKTEYLLERNLAEDPDPALGSLAKKMVAGETGWGSYRRDGADKVAYYAPVSGTPWSLAVIISRAEYFSPLKLLAAGIAGAGLVVSALIALLVALLVSRSLRPLGALKRAFEALARGDTRLRIAVASKDEIGSLAASYDAVIGNLSSLIAAIKGANASSALSGQELAANAEEMSSAIEELEATMESMGARSRDLSAAVAGSGEAMSGIGLGIEGLNALIERQSPALADSAAAALATSGSTPAPRRCCR